MADDMELSRWPLYNHTFKSKAERSAGFEAWIAEESSRVKAQRFVFAQLPDCVAKTALAKAMIERAKELLDSGYPGAADQLLEFVPATDAERFQDEYFGEP
jgi:hypothetical protein